MAEVTMIPKVCENCFKGEPGECSCCHGSYNDCKTCEINYWVERFLNCYPFKFPIELWNDGECSRCREVIKPSGHICKDLKKYVKNKAQNKQVKKS